MTEQEKPRGTITIEIATDGGQHIAMDGAVGPSDIAIAMFWLARVGNQIADHAAAGAASRSDGLAIARAIPSGAPVPTRKD